jgi:hypothetical protein
MGDSRTTFNARPSYYTFGLIWAVHLSILLQTPLNNDPFRFLQPEPAGLQKATGLAESLAPARFAGLSALPQTV